MSYRPRVEPFPQGVVVSLHGELDAYQAPDLHAAFAEVAAGARGATVVLDLAAVTFLDSTVLGTVVGLVRRQRESGGELRVVLPETAARRIFELTGLDGVLDVRASRAEAVAG
jgi:anti-sigma B factor antagonist